MYKAYRYRLYPTEEQKTMLAKTFGCTRFIYNKMLEERIKNHKTTTPAKFKKEFTWLKEVDSLALCNAQLHLEEAFRRHFKNPKHFGKPRFKSKRDNIASYATNNQKGSVRIENGKIRLPKIGFVRLRMHRPLMDKSTIKTVTVSRTATGKFFVSILVEYENQVLPIIPKNFLGLDFAMDGLFFTSDGEFAGYPKFLRKAQKRLARAQQRLSRKQPKSKNREKQRIRVAKIHEKVANQRHDFLHKKAFALANDYDAIGIENISVKTMAKRKKGGKFSFGKSVSDNGWGLFTEILGYKLAWQGKSLVKVDKWFPSSQLCHKCGFRNREVKDLTVREWTCPECGAHHHRDINAAINIGEEAKRILA